MHSLNKSINYTTERNSRCQNSLTVDTAQQVKVKEFSFKIRSLTRKNANNTMDISFKKQNLVYMM